MKRSFLILTAVFFTGLALVIVWLTLDRGASEEQKHQGLSLSIVTFLAQPKHSGKEILPELTGIDAELVLYDLDSGLVYFSVPRSIKREKAAQQLSRIPSKVEWGKSDRKGRIILGPLIYRGQGEFFRFPAKHFLVEPDSQVSIRYQTVTYTVTAQEIEGSLYNRSLYGGREYLKIPGSSGEVFNFGSVIALPEKSTSIARLASEICKNAKSPLEEAQRLLDFVTNEIEYDQSESFWSQGRQVVRRPVETLLTRRATCGGKITIYGSLLEQRGIPYWLAYYSRERSGVGHAGVFVLTESGDERYTLNLEGKSYHYAETTNPGFRLGITNLNPALGFDPTKPKALYQPARDILLFPQTGETLALRN
jgi:transglutaminase-like putative cysteine protease